MQVNRLIILQPIFVFCFFGDNEQSTRELFYFQFYVLISSCEPLFLNVM